MDAVNPVKQIDQPQILRLIACPCLAFERGKIDRYVPAGASVAEHLRAIGWNPEGLHARVFIDGAFIEQAQWEYAVPRAGQAFVTRVIPGEGGGKDAFRIVALLAVVALALAAPPLLGLTGVLGGVLSGTISILGSLRTNSLLPARPR